MSRTSTSFVSSARVQPTPVSIAAPIFRLNFVVTSVLAILVLSADWRVARATLVALMIAYGAGTELVQGLLPYRSCELADWLNDVAGIVAGTAMLWPARLPRIAALGVPRGT